MIIIIVQVRFLSVVDDYSVSLSSVSVGRENCIRMDG